MRFLTTGLLVAASALMLGSVVAPAWADLDPPAVEVSQARPSSVRLIVTAGPSGLPAGIGIDWMKKSSFDAYGGWPPSPAPEITWGVFDGAPTFNTLGTGTSYQLAAGQNIEVELGQLFDETGVVATSTAELEPGTEYVVRMRAQGGAFGSGSAWTATVVITTAPVAQNCTYTQGYWKNHPEMWPVTTMTLGTVNYTAAQLLLVLGTPAQGNGLLILAHQLIAAKLNIANGADPTDLAANIAAADAMIGALMLPPVGGGSLPPGAVNALANLLDDYNNGIIGPGHCATVDAKSATWGRVKSLYHR